MNKIQNMITQESNGMIWVWQSAENAAELLNITLIKQTESSTTLHPSRKSRGACKASPHGSGDRTWTPTGLLNFDPRSLFNSYYSRFWLWSVTCDRNAAVSVAEIFGQRMWFSVSSRDHCICHPLPCVMKNCGRANIASLNYRRWHRGSLRVIGPV